MWSRFPASAPVTHEPLTTVVPTMSLSPTTATTGRTRVFRRIVLAMFAVGIVAPGFIGVEPARAETTLVSSSPADGEKVAVAPARITVVFNETVPSNSVVQAVCDQAPAPIGPAEFGADGISISVPVVGALPVGTCNVTYSIPQPDGKVATGVFSFEVLDPASIDPGDLTEADMTDGGNLLGEPPPVSGPLGLARMVAYMALAALFGGAVLIVLVWPEGVDDGLVPRFFRIAWFVGTISTFFVMVLTVAIESRISVTAALNPTEWFGLFDSLSGAVILARFFLVAASAGVMVRPERLLDPRTQAVSLAPMGIAVASLSLTRATAEFSLVGTLAGAFHSVSIALWFGGLALLLLAVLAGPGEEDLVHAVRGYTRLAPAFVTVAVVSGTLHLIQLDGGGFLSSRHGRLIVLKVIGVAAMVYLGMLMRQVVATRLGKAKALNAKIAFNLRRAVATEAAFGVFVLALSSWAVATLPANIEPPGTDRTNYAFVGERSGGAFDVQVKVTPAMVGLNAVRIDVHSPESGLTDLTVQFNPPTANTASVTLSVPLDGKGAARLPLKEGVPFGTAGLWTVIVSGNGPDGPLPSVTYTVSVMANDDNPDAAVLASTTSPVGTAATVPMTALVPVGGSAAVGATTVPGIQPVTATVVP